MTDAQAALAQVREALADRPSAGPWVATLRDPGTFQVATVDNFGVYSRHPDHGGNAAGFPEHDAAYIAKCNPENIAAILAHVDAQAAEIERLEADSWQLRKTILRVEAERDDLRRQLTEAEQRFDWLATRLEDVQIDDADPHDHYHGDEEDVPYPVLWRRAIDAAMGASNERIQKPTRNTR